MDPNVCRYVLLLRPDLRRGWRNFCLPALRKISYVLDLFF